MASTVADLQDAKIDDLKEIDSPLQNYLQGHASHLLTTLFIVAELHEMFKPYPQFLDYNKYLVSSF